MEDVLSMHKPWLGDNKRGSMRITLSRRNVFRWNNDSFLSDAVECASAGVMGYKKKVIAVVNCECECSRGNGYSGKKDPETSAAILPLKINVPMEDQSLFASTQNFSARFSYWMQQNSSLKTCQHVSCYFPL